MKANEQVRYIVLAAIVVCVVMAIFPPMMMEAREVRIALGYYPIWRSVTGGSRLIGQIDFGRLLLQWLIVAAVAGGIIYWLRTRKP